MDNNQNRNNNFFVLLFANMLVLDFLVVKINK